ncbi:hypothetical protein M758_4G042000 [Ceratodon purpureus]|nr:hypothetical protein M758_4G042000 [Ceratodon purpureus]
MVIDLGGGVGIWCGGGIGCGVRIAEGVSCWRLGSQVAAGEEGEMGPSEWAGARWEGWKSDAALAWVSGRGGGARWLGREALVTPPRLVSPPVSEFYSSAMPMAGFLLGPSSC